MDMDVRWRLVSTGDFREIVIKQERHVARIGSPAKAAADALFPKSNSTQPANDRADWDEPRMSPRGTPFLISLFRSGNILI